MLKGPAHTQRILSIIACIANETYIHMHMHTQVNIQTYILRIYTNSPLTYTNTHTKVQTL